MYINNNCVTFTNFFDQFIDFLKERCKYINNDLNDF